MVAVAAFTVWRLTGRYEPEPLTRQDHQSNVVYYTAFGVFFAGFAVKAWLQGCSSDGSIRRSPRPRLSLSQAQRPPPRDPPPDIGRVDREAEAPDGLLTAPVFPCWDVCLG